MLGSTAGRPPKEVPAAEAWRGCLSTKSPIRHVLGPGLEPCPPVFCAPACQPVLVAEDAANYKKTPQLRQDPDEGKKHQDSNLVIIITVANVLCSSDEPSSILSPLFILSPFMFLTTL